MSCDRRAHAPIRAHDTNDTRFLRAIVSESRRANRTFEAVLAVAYGPRIVRLNDNIQLPAPVCTCGWRLRASGLVGIVRTMLCGRLILLLLSVILLQAIGGSARLSIVQVDVELIDAHALFCESFAKDR